MLPSWFEHILPCQVLVEPCHVSLSYRNGRCYLIGGQHRTLVLQALGQESGLNHLKMSVLLQSHFRDRQSSLGICKCPFCSTRGQLTSVKSHTLTTHLYPLPSLWESLANNVSMSGRVVYFVNQVNKVTKTVAGFGLWGLVCWPLSQILNVIPMFYVRFLGSDTQGVPQKGTPS